ncbi:MAG: hypothetical protein FWG03_09795 [Clostridiales bacterium]|nr:hypothetical protein [Clostridiales bacterium]
MEKRKIRRVVVLVLVLIVVIVVALWGKQYYNDRYVSSDYYAMVPPGYDVTPGSLLSQNGDEMGPGVEFFLTAYDENGGPKEVSMCVYSVDSDFYHGEDMPAPGDFLWVKASKQIVTGWGITDESQVPEKALERLKAG